MRSKDGVFFFSLSLLPFCFSHAGHRQSVNDGRRQRRLNTWPFA